MRGCDYDFVIEASAENHQHVGVRFGPKRHALLRCMSPLLTQSGPRQVQHRTARQPERGTAARIFSISVAVKARNVWVRMLPSISAASNTAATVSSSGASKTHTWS